MESIVIKTLEMQNYRQYVKQKITFGYDKKKNICIVQGKNGFGKSNLFNAINWCFFGVEEHLKSKNNSKDMEPICNTRLFLESRPGAKLITTVKLLLDTPYGEKQFERKITTTKRSSGNSDYKTGRSELTIMERIGLNWEIAPYPDYIVSQILPYQMRSFFFIDGEKLRVAFENIQPEDIKSSIFDLSHITLLQKTVDHLGTFKSSLRKKISDAPELSDIEQLISQVNEEMELEKSEFGTLQAELEKARLACIELTAQIGETGDKDVDALELRRQELKKNIDYFKTSLEALQSEYQAYLLKLAPIILCRPAIEKTQEMIAKSQSTGQYPPPKPSHALVQHILKNNKCICGTDLKKSENKKNRKKIENLRESEVDETIKDVHKLQVILGQFNDDFRRFPEKVTSFENMILAIENKYSDEQKKLKGVEVKLANISVKQVKRLIATRDQYETVMEETKSQMNKLQASIEFKADRVKQAEKKYDQLLVKQGKHNDIKKRIDTCDTCINLLLQIKEKVMKEVRIETNKYTKEYFYKLVSAKNYDKFDILDDYKLLLERDGFNCIKSLSAAEHLCLGYSFMSALRKSSGFLAPIIIDTPIARVDEHYRTNIANWIKEALPVAQVILLILDTEYTSEFRKELEPILNQEYLIKHNKIKRISKVVSYEC